MDPASAISALTSTFSSASAGGGVTSMNHADMVMRQGGVGGNFDFQMPEAPQPVVETGSFAPTQVSEVYGTTGVEPTNYGHMVQQMVRDVNSAQETAGAKVRDVLMGGPTTINDAMVSVQEAGVSFKLLSQVRNKLVDSYNEIMRMQV